MNDKQTQNRCVMKFVEVWPRARVSELLGVLPTEHHDVPSLRHILENSDGQGLFNQTYSKSKDR